MVLLWPYLPLYFERCGLTHDGQFADAAANHRAVRLVHLLASSQWVNDEGALPLAKVMCGLAPSTALLPTDDAPTEDELKLCLSLLHAVTQHWDTLRNTTVDALRETFLMREGHLTQANLDAGWRLDVQKKSVDVLLQSVPWSFGMVKLGWMPTPLHVQW